MKHIDFLICILISANIYTMDGESTFYEGSNLLKRALLPSISTKLPRPTSEYVTPLTSFPKQTPDIAKPSPDSIASRIFGLDQQNHSQDTHSSKNSFRFFDFSQLRRIGKIILIAGSSYTLVKWYFWVTDKYSLKKKYDSEVKK